MSNTLRNYVFGRNRRNPVVKVLASRAEKIVKAYRNFNYNHHSNGEEFLLQRLAQANPSCLFDVGANNGDWAAMAARYIPAAQIYAFEIVPDTAQKCKKIIAPYKNIILQSIGLSDAPGTVEVNTYVGYDTHASMLNYDHQLPIRKIKAEVMKGDDFATANDIQEIDLLKIDVEGAENKVIAGFASTLRTGRVKMLQFEYGRANILSRFLLKDWYELLTPLGYKIGKLYPNYVEFKDYELTDEDFIGPNYVALRQDQDQLFDLLRG
jgi:FkbM family methyltransferase